MRETGSIAELRGWLASERASGRRVALVPTMGFLHAGHLSLVEAARARADVVVMTLFVNPLQFGPGEDFERYPRDPERDRGLAASSGVDILFAPAPGEMYHDGADMRIAAGGIAMRWEGEVRPGHFDGVLTVVAKLFNIAQPDVACFGQKDIQQVALVRRMIREFNFPVELLVSPIMREPDGLAMSSRNVYLSPQERRAALALSRGLHAAEARWRDGETDANALRTVVHDALAMERDVAPDYVALVDPETLAPADRATAGSIIVLAARVGRTRLIDNVILAS